MRYRTLPWVMWKMLVVEVIYDHDNNLMLFGQEVLLGLGVQNFH